jgi:hypothetical protein
MNRKGLPALYKDPFARLVLALLKPRRAGGWIRVEDLANECRMAKSTVRRHLDALEAAGFPIEHHIDSGVARRHALGIRSLLVGMPVQADPDPSRWSDRDCPAPKRPTGRTGVKHPWRTPPSGHFP